MHRRTLVALATAAVTAATISAPAFAQSSGEIRIAHIYSKTGPLEAYGKQTQTGLMMGLNYATGGSMTVNGKKLVVIEKDDQGKPDLGKSLLATAYSDDKADIAVGPTASGVALAMLPVAEEYKKILLVEPAVADSITGDKWNKYIFRTGRNSSQDAISNAVAVDKEGTTIATLAQDNAFGRDGVKAFKDAVKKAKVAHEEYLPAATTDFTAGARRLEFLGAHGARAQGLGGDAHGFLGLLDAHEEGGRHVHPHAVFGDQAFLGAAHDFQFQRVHVHQHAFVEHRQQDGTTIHDDLLAPEAGAHEGGFLGGALVQARKNDADGQQRQKGDAGNAAHFDQVVHLLVSPSVECCAVGFIAGYMSPGCGLAMHR